jgi:uncharacterized repeat protein (TIGR01451 family)
LRAIWLVGACVLGGAMVLALTSILCGQARAADVAASSASALDVVINEVAWMGTAASGTDEWIELYNTTDQDIDLSGWTLASSDGTPTVHLGGTVLAHGHYLLERTDDDTISDIPADQIYTGDLLLGGETLTLTNGGGAVVDTANAENAGAWPAGSNNPDHTMERIDATAPDTDDNWCTNDGAIRTGLDAGGNPINGTPKARNSCHQSPIEDVADLVVTKTGPVTVSPGSLITYHVTVSNTGTTTATATLITDCFPSGVVFITQTSPFAFSHSDGVTAWEMGDVPTNACNVITITGRVTGTTSGTITNLVTATTTASETRVSDNTADWRTAIVVTHSPLDVVINEVAWAGHAGYASDEWIELYNPTNATIDLEGWTLASGDGSPSIHLTGVISPHGYYLLERDDDNTVSTIPADQVYSGGLNNTGESLTLRDAANTIIDSANGDGGAWPSGAGWPDYRSMERRDPTAPDTDANWCTNDGSIRTGQDAGGNPINGTPKAQNSCYQPPPSELTDLKVTKLGPTAVSTGGLITYQIWLSNTGAITATTVRVTDTFPADVSFITQTSVFTFSRSSEALIWEVGDVPAGVSHLVTVTGRITDTACGTFVNSITATTTASETMTTNNHDTWTTTVSFPGWVDLGIVKTGPDTTIPGSTITYYIRLTNTGSITATAVRVTDTLPVAAELVTQISPFPFAQLKRALTWTVGDVPPETHYLITLTARVRGTAIAPLTNMVTVTTATSETTLTNNSGAWETALGPAGEPHILISAVLHDGYQYGDLDEAVELTNVGTAPTDLGGWYLADDPGDSSGATFPDGALLAPGASIWCARSSVAFADTFGFRPDYETDDSDPAVPELTGSWPGFANDGDECALLARSDQPVDVLVTGDSPGQTGWSGAPLQPWAPTTAFAKAGQILYRKLDQVTARPVPDTDTAADWAQDPDDHIDGRKVRYPGWDLVEFFQTAKVTQTANLEVAVAPDNAYEVIKRHLEGATASILVEGYTFENAHLIDVVVGRAQAGVEVRLLLEGGKVTDQERWFCQRLDAAGGEAYFLHSDDEADIYARYRNQHAKFIIVDGEILIVGSENFNYSALPADSKSNGTWGRRGTFLITDAPAVVERAQAIFDRDLDTAWKDIVPWNEDHPRYGEPGAGFTATYVTSDWVTYTVHFSQPLILTDTLFAFEVVQAPENSLRDADSLLGLIERAGDGDTVLVEQLNEPAHWGAAAGTPHTDPNPRLEAIVAAARRGAAARILLNGSQEAGSVAENSGARDYVNGIARHEGLNLKVQLGDPAGRGIHNKMVLVWLEGEGGYAHVGSINGTEASNKRNREVALQVRADDVYHYLARVFEVDWWLAQRTFLPVLMRNYAPPTPPVGYVVISEVYYATGSPSLEWVEVCNPTDHPIDLSSYKIGDAETADQFEGMYQFPPGTTLPTQGALVIAFDGSAVAQADLEMSDHSDTPDMIKSATWGSGDWTLRNDGDQVMLLGAADQVVDLIVWGDAAYAGVDPHPGVNLFTHSLERYPYYYDTDDCAFDFRDRYPPTPGTLPEGTKVHTMTPGPSIEARGRLSCPQNPHLPPPIEKIPRGYHFNEAFPEE